VATPNLCSHAHTYTSSHTHTTRISKRKRDRGTHTTLAKWGSVSRKIKRIIKKFSAGVDKEDARGVHHPYDNSFVITMELANFATKRVLIDNGSLADILYLSAFQQTKIWRDKQRLIDTVRCRVGHLFFFKGSFVFSNIFRVWNRGTRSRHLVYWFKNHKYGFMHKRTSLELGPELKYILGKKYKIAQ
jgi:hypothetical protein